MPRSSRSCQRSGGSWARRVRCPTIDSTRSWVRSSRSSVVRRHRRLARHARASAASTQSTSPPVCEGAGRAGGQDQAGQAELHRRHQREEAPVEGHRLHRLALQHPAEQLARAEVAGLGGVEACTAPWSRRSLSRPPRPMATVPWVQPASSRSGTSVSSSRAQAHTQPGSSRPSSAPLPMSHQEPIQSRYWAAQARAKVTSGGSSPARRTWRGEVAAGGQAQHPGHRHRLRGEPAREHHRTCPFPPALRHGRRLEQAVHRRPHPGVRLAAQSRRHLVGPHPPQGEVRGDEEQAPARPTEHRQDPSAALTHAHQRRPAGGQKTVQVPVTERRLHQLDAEPPGRPGEPRAETLVVTLAGGRRRRRARPAAGGEAGAGRHRLERLAHALLRPDEGRESHRHPPSPAAVTRPSARTA